MNRCLFVGRLTRDPELRYTPRGKAVVDVGLAVRNPFKKREDGSAGADFVDLVAWDQRAEFLANYCPKGHLVSVEARAEQQTWEDKNGGGTRKKTVFVVDRVDSLQVAK